MDQGHAVSEMGLAPTGHQNGLEVVNEQAESDLEQNQATGFQQPAAEDNGETMNNQLQAAPAEYAQPGAASQPADRQDLAARVCDAEMALYHAQQDIEQKDQAIERLRKQLAEAQPGDLQNGQQPPGPGDG